LEAERSLVDDWVLDAACPREGPAPRDKGLRYLQGIDNAEIIDAVHAHRAPMIPVNARLRL
jgi:hypothetical protein